ncbi:hypothetical protein [Streptomyces flavofungini]|nr:hypothetical protein [Streptomyces flavofungini]GHC77039.1 hypothetical protein GCM10010349_57370 [Streptomyces flavofungini]
MVAGAGKFAERLYEACDGKYASFTELHEHGGRLARTLDDPEKIKVAAYATRFENSRYGCGIVIQKKRILLLPEQRYVKATQAFMGALRGKGDVFAIRYDQIKRVQTYDSGESANFIQAIFRGRYTNDNIRILLWSGEFLLLESIMGNRSPALMAMFKKRL